MAKQRLLAMVSEWDKASARAKQLRKSQSLLRRDLKQLMGQASDLTAEQVAQFGALRSQQSEVGSELAQCNRLCGKLIDDILMLLRDIRDGGLLF